MWFWTSFWTEWIIVGISPCYCILGNGNGNLLQYPCLNSPTDRRGYNLKCHKESDMTEPLSSSSKVSQLWHYWYQGKSVPCWGSVLCAAGYWGASLAATHQMPVTPSTIWLKNKRFSRCCQIFPAWKAKLPPLKNSSCIDLPLFFFLTVSEYSRMSSWNFFS